MRVRERDTSAKLRRGIGVKAKNERFKAHSLLFIKILIVQIKLIISNLNPTNQDIAMMVPSFEL